MKAWLFGCLFVVLRCAADVPTANAADVPPRHWAFTPVRHGLVPPAVKNPGWCLTDLDRFVLARVEASGAAPLPSADPRTLIRRLTFDLTGLPPTREEVDAFERACLGDPGVGSGSSLKEWPGTQTAERAYLALLDRLLASPRQGERQARLWLDVARYSDTKGYVYDREERTFAHARVYRDWVIHAFNQDLPYHRFLALQIAADQFVPQGSPDLAAMGFITLGRRFLGVTHDIIDDRIDVVTRGTMALTAQCARCHDHKFDPIPTQDYYSLYGIFRATAERLSALGTESTDPEYRKLRTKLADKMSQRREEVAARARARAGDYLAAQLELARYPEEGFDEILGPDDLNPAMVRRWRDWLHTAERPDATHPVFGPWHALSRLPSADFPARAKAMLAILRRNPSLDAHVRAAFDQAPASMTEVLGQYRSLFDRALAVGTSTHPDSASAAVRAFLLDPDGPCAVPDTGIVDNDQFFINDIREELWKLQSELDRWLIAHPGSPHAVTLADRPAGPNPRVFKRGNPGNPGEEIPRRFLSALSGTNPPTARAHFTDGSGRRELAEAIAHPDNPLTARVAVNRVWAQHFGSGLVGTPSDFGVRADPPADPDLLDWLADRFVAEGWSLKSLHRLVCRSATYRQRAAGPVPANEPAPPVHTRVPVRRLDFEQLRDAFLSVTGELDPSPAATPLDNFAPSNRHRTIYGLVDRQFLPATMRLFDFPNPDSHVAARHETTVPQQALFLLNHAWLAARAKALAARDADLNPVSRIRSLHRRVYQRAASDHDIETALRFVKLAESERTAPPPPPPPSAWQCGYGEYDEQARRVKSFRPLPHFTGMAWQGGPTFPDPTLGWVQLTPAGGHPGNDLQHACIRRWTAPRDVTVSISGDLVHEVDAGDGIRGFVVSSRHGELRSATVRNGRTHMVAGPLELRAGDTLDFIVHIGAVLNSDQHLWSPVIKADDADWSARRDFPVGPARETNLLAPWEQYAQVLLLANEFAFVD